MDSDFWADEAANRVVTTGKDPVVKGGVSPSGVPHIGNFNEVLRGYFVTQALQDLGSDPRQVFTSDDRDPLRRIPSTLLDSDGAVVEVDNETKQEFERHLGKPYVSVPDPFSCCESWADHFTNVLERDAETLGITVDFYSNDELYRDGCFLEPTRIILSKLERSRELIGRYQRTVGDDYIPFMPMCKECGRITATPTSVNLEDELVSYRCRDTELAGEYEVKGCGHKGRASFTEGKLPWRFEWPAQWMVLGVGFEPFGKDHAEGSWESGQAISRELLKIEPPEPLVYEFFLVDGSKMSASEGNIYTVNDLLGYIEPEVLKYFFAKDPSKQRDFQVKELDHLVNEFDRIEAIHFGREEAADERERVYADRVYPMLVDDDRERVRPPYTFAAMVGVSESEEAIVDVLVRSGHLPENHSKQQRQDALGRVELARNWARSLDNEYYLEVLDKPPDLELDGDIMHGLRELADYVEEGHTDDEIQSKIFETARRHDVPVGEFFRVGYRLFLGEDSGPKLGPLIAALDRDFVVERLRNA